MNIHRPSTSGFVRSAIAHKKFVYAITAVICVLGAIGLRTINKDEFPTFDITQGLVVAVYPGATADKVESTLAGPLEEMLLTIPEVKRSNLETVSKDGVCYLYVDINCGQKRKTEVWGKIKQKLVQGKVFLPPGVVTVQVIDDFSDVSAVLLALESDDRGWGEMQEYARRLQEKLRGIDRLGSVSIIGGQQEEIAVTLDMTRLSGYGISPATIMAAYLSSGINIPAGNFNTDYTSAPIIVESDVSSEEEIAKKIVYSSPDGTVIRMEDIAKIERRLKKTASEVHYNGNSVLVMNLVMRPGNNIVAFGEDVDAVLEEFTSTLPPTVHVHRVSEQPAVVRSSVMGFLRDLLISMLVVIFVMIMMFPMRSALIASSGVPVCTLITIAVMFVSGMCLNTVTLAALIVVLGMIVDDSIITMDGYMDKLGRGMDRIEAASASARELFMPMFMATLSICSMFFPMLKIITGYLGDFIQSFPWIVLIALMASLVYAVTVVPSLETRFITSADSSSYGFVARMQHHLFNALQKGYDKVQVKAFAHPWVTIGAGVVAVVLGILMFSRLNVQMMPFAARKSFAVEINLESGNNLEDTKAVADSLEKLLLMDGRINSVTTFIGTGAPRYHCTYSPKLPSPTFAQMIVSTTSELATEEILPYAEAKYEHYFPNALIRIKQMDYQGATEPVSIRVTGPDRERFLWVADSLRNYMRSLDTDLKWVHTNSGSYRTAVKVNMLQEEAARAGVDKTLVGLSLAGGFSETGLVTVYENGKTVPVNFYSEEISDRMTYQEVGDRMVQSAVPGVSVPLRQVAEVTPDWRMESLVRYGGRESITIGADLKYGHSHPRVMDKIDSYVKEFKQRNTLPEDVEINYGGLSETNNVIGPQIALSFIAAVAVMFMFLLLHFKKVSLTVLSLVLSLLCLFGASFGLWAFNLDFGMTSVLGIVSLIGIIVRNGIIMFEYAEELHFEQGYSVREAAMLSGQRRMRPIFLTSCTTALGVLPMIIAGDALWQPMGLVICFGIMFSIALIVFVMPVSYWKVYDKSGKEDVKR
ncbi:MAG: efflux RND transporter permease subunit [Bacteroidales bacterium]|nr:efflux RND transporter permease subunit [Bacteroidales bacterium]